MQASAKDPKTELQEWLQGRKMKLPVYRVVGTLGAAHKQTFDVECEIAELELVERGIGASRRAGEQAAAAAMLQTLKAQGGPIMERRSPALRPHRHRRQAQCRQVHPAQRPGRAEDQHHLAQGTDHAPPHHRHPHRRGATQFVFVDTPGFQTRHNNALNRSLNKTVLGAVGDVDLVLFVVEAGKFTPADAKVLELLKPGIPALLVANKLDEVHRRADIAPWLQEMQQRHAFAEFVPMSAKNAKDIERLFAICEKYLPEQAWWYGEDELTDRSEKFLASETVREKLFRLTGDELPYTSTVVIDKFEEEPSPKHGRMVRIAATIVVERDGHKAMVIGDKGERLKRIGTEARQELEKLMAARCSSSSGSRCAVAGPTTKHA